MVAVNNISVADTYDFSLVFFGGDLYLGPEVKPITPHPALGCTGYIITTVVKRESRRAQTDRTAGVLFRRYGNNDWIGFYFLFLSHK